jgi:hypothetical protein
MPMRGARRLHRIRSQTPLRSDHGATLSRGGIRMFPTGEFPTETLKRGKLLEAWDRFGDEIASPL